MPFDLSFGAVLSIHITSMIITIATVLVADTMGLLWWRGKVAILPALAMKTLHWMVFVGLVVSITTGALMASTGLSYLFSQPAFVIKLGFVLTLLINSFVIHRHLSLATTQSYYDLPDKSKRTLILSGAISTTSWICVLIASQFFVL